MSKTTDRARRGFTLIEMLIVLVVIITLASMILFGASALGIGSKKAKSGTILAAVRKGIELTIASKGGSISPAEHPFAGSRAPNGAVAGFRFKGWRGRAQPPSPPGAPSYSTVIMPGAFASPTYKGPEEWWFQSGANQTRAFMDDDLFEDVDRVPGLLGMPRGHMGVIGSQQRYVTRYFNVTRVKPREAVTDPNVYVDAVLPIKGQLVTLEPPEVPIPALPALPPGSPQDNKKAIDYLFGSSNVQAELSSLKAMFETPTDPTYAAPDNLPDQMIFGDLVWSQDKDGWVERDGLKHEPKPLWEGGRVKVAAQTPNQFLRYRLRGLAIYDAWGREVFYSYGAGGGVRLLSLGGDGAYRVDPGVNHVLDTTTVPGNPTVPVWTLSGDDKDGLRDNVTQEVAE